MISPWKALKFGQAVVWKRSCLYGRRNDWSQSPRIPGSLSLPALGDCGFTLGLQPVAFSWLKGKKAITWHYAKKFPLPNPAKFGAWNSWQLKKGFPSEEHNCRNALASQSLDFTGWEKHLWFEKNWWEMEEGSREDYGKEKSTSRTSRKWSKILISICALPNYYRLFKIKIDRLH